MKAKGLCDVCRTEIEVNMCCSGLECGCMGLPEEPPVCSKECYAIFISKYNTDKNIQEKTNKTAIQQMLEYFEEIGLTLTVTTKEKYLEIKKQEIIKAVNYGQNNHSVSITHDKEVSCSYYESISNSKNDK